MASEAKELLNDLELGPNVIEGDDIAKFLNIIEELR